MSSMVQQAIEMGIDSWDGETGAWNWNENDYNEDDYSEEEPTWFATSKEALSKVSKTANFALGKTIFAISCDVVPILTATVNFLLL